MKKCNLKKEIDNSREFEVAEALMSQGHKRLSNIIRILNNKFYAEGSTKYTPHKLHR